MNRNVKTKVNRENESRWTATVGAFLVVNIQRFHLPERSVAVTTTPYNSIHTTILCTEAKVSLV